MSNDKLKPAFEVNLDGETIEKTMFVNLCGADKWFILFKSGRVLVLPVHRTCSVQEGTILELSEDFDAMLESIDSDVRAVFLERQTVRDFVKGLKDDMDGLKSG